MSNIILDKTFLFAVRIVKLVKVLQQERKEYILSKQLLRSGTSVGALVREAEHAQSKKDFIHKTAIGLKEINETKYWLNLLYETSIIYEREYNSIHTDCEEILKIMVKIIKTSKANL